MIRLTAWNQTEKKLKPRNLLVDPEHVVAVLECESNGVKIARVYMDSCDVFEVCDFGRTTSDYIDTAKRCGIHDSEREPVS